MKREEELEAARHRTKWQKNERAKEHKRSAFVRLQQQAAEMEAQPNGTLLRAMLQVAVPLNIMIWQREKRTPEWRQERAEVCAQTIAEDGDKILYRSKIPGKTANAVNRLAEGIALLAFQPGGVKMFGLHFEVK